MRRAPASGTLRLRPRRTDHRPAALRGNSRPSRREQAARGAGGVRSAGRIRQVDDAESRRLHARRPCAIGDPRGPARRRIRGCVARAVRRCRSPDRRAAGRHPDGPRPPDPHRRDRRPADRIDGEPARLRLGARTPAGSGRGRAEGAVSDARALARAVGRRDGQGQGSELPPQDRGAPVLDPDATRRTHRASGGCRQGSGSRFRGARPRCGDRRRLWPRAPSS